MQNKSIDLAAKRLRRSSGQAVEKQWSDGGPAEGAMAAYFASRKQIRFRLLQFLLLDLTRLSPQEGLAVFNRSAHSAGPGLFMQWCEDAMG